MRETCKSSSASQMYAGGPSSPAWAKVNKPSARTRANTRENFDGGCPFSLESRPTAQKYCLNFNKDSNVFIATSSLKWRKKQGIKRCEIPNSLSPLASARLIPSNTTDNDIPLSVW